MKKILIIEDNTEVRENLEETLELSGYEVETAEDGNIGVKKAVDNPPDLIICDVMMPQLDGFGVLNILSKKQETADIPFVFLTAKSEKSDFRRGMNLGADDYITKPFFKDELLQVVETRLRKSQRLKQNFDKNKIGWNSFINEAKGYEELKKLSENHRSQVYNKKSNIIQEGAYPHYLFFLNKGKVKIYKTNEFGKEYIVNILGPGDFIGYTALIQDQAYNFTATTLEDTELSLIPKEDFQKLLFANKDVASKLIKMLADNVIEKEQQLLNLAYNSVRKRVAEALVVLHKRFEKEGKGEISILREDLARVVGTAKESVIRMLSEFREDGYIELQDGSIKIIDLSQLENLPA